MELIRNASAEIKTILRVEEESNHINYARQEQKSRYSK